MCVLHLQCQSGEDLLDLYLMVSETSKQKQVSKFKRKESCRECECDIDQCCAVTTLCINLLHSVFFYNDYECFLFLVRQEQELRNGGTVDKKLSTLADLFRPPIELMHKGSFETVSSQITGHFKPHVFIQFV